MARDRTKEREKTKARRAARIAAGLCACGKERLSTRSKRYGDACLEAIYKLVNARVARHRAAGLCIVCGAPRKPGRMHCGLHLRKLKIYSARHDAKKREQKKHVDGDPQVQRVAEEDGGPGVRRSA